MPNLRCHITRLSQERAHQLPSPQSSLLTLPSSIASRSSASQGRGHWYFGMELCSPLVAVTCSFLSLRISISVSLRPDHIMTDLLYIKGPSPCVLSLSPPSVWAFISLSRRGGKRFRQELASGRPVSRRISNLNAKHGQPFIQLPLGLHPTHQL